MASPVNVVLTYEDGSTEKFHQTPAIWEKNQKETSVNINTKKKIKSISLDGGIYMDADTINNSWPLKGF